MENFQNKDETDERKYKMFKMPESSNINPPHKIEKSINDSKKSFYELAKNKISYFSHQEFLSWLSSMIDDENWSENFAESPALGLINFKISPKDDFEKYITNLEIAIDISKFSIDGENYEDLIPFIIEHEITEVWIRAKRGFLEEREEEFTQEMRERNHQLALRREFLLAEQAGKAEKLFKWRMLVCPEKEDEYRYAWEKAKKRVNNPA